MSVHFVGDITTKQDANFRRLFRDMHAIEEITGLDKIDVSNVTVLGGAFEQLKNLKYLDLSTWKTDVLKDNENDDASLRYCFSGDTSLEYLNAANFNTQKVTNFACVFQGTTSLKTLDISGWDTSSITSGGDSIVNSDGLKNLTEVKLGPNFYNSILRTTGYNKRLIDFPVEKKNSEYWYSIDAPDTHYDGSLGMPNRGPLTKEEAANYVSEWQNRCGWYVKDTDDTIKYLFRYDGNGGIGHMGDIVAEINIADNTSHISLSPNQYSRYGYDLVGFEMSYNDQPLSLMGIQPNIKVSELNQAIKEVLGLGQDSELPRFNIITLKAKWEFSMNIGFTDNRIENVEIPAGYQAVINNLPGGSTYEVEEVSKSGWTLVSSTGTTGKILPNKTPTAVFTNKYMLNSISVTPKISKLVDDISVKDEANGKFSFTLTQTSGNEVTKVEAENQSGSEGENQAGLEEENQTDPEGETEKYTETVQNNWSSVQFSPIQLTWDDSTEAGNTQTYVFEIIENDLKDGSIYNKDSGKIVYTVVLSKVNTAEEGKDPVYEIKAEETYQYYEPVLDENGDYVKDSSGNIVYEPAESKPEEDGETEYVPVFNNTTKPGMLMVSKKVIKDSGLTGNPNASFTFEIQLNDVQGNPINGRYSVSYVSENSGSMTDEESQNQGEKSDQIESDDKAVTFENGKAIIELKEDQSVIISDLPNGARYYIKELDGTDVSDSQNASKMPAGYRWIRELSPDQIKQADLDVSNPADSTERAGTIDADQTSCSTLINEYKASGTLSFTVLKHLVSDPSVARQQENGEFTFKLEQIPAPDSSGNPADPVRIEEFSANSGGIAKTSNLNISRPGNYVYQISEAVPNQSDKNYDPTILYDESVYQVNVLVTDNGDGTLNAEKTAYKKRSESSSEKELDAGSDGFEDYEIRNDYEAESVIDKFKNEDGSYTVPDIEKAEMLFRNIDKTTKLTVTKNWVIPEVLLNTPAADVSNKEVSFNLYRIALDKPLEAANPPEVNLSDSSEDPLSKDDSVSNEPESSMLDSETVKNKTLVGTYKITSRNNWIWDSEKGLEEPLEWTGKDENGSLVYYAYWIEEKDATGAALVSSTEGWYHGGSLQLTNKVIAVELPETGGSGTEKLILSGILLLAGTGLFASVQNRNNGKGKSKKSSSRQ